MPVPEVVAVEEEEEDEEKEEDSWSPERREAERLVAALLEQWGPPIQTLSRAGRAFEGLEALLGGARGGTFDLQVHDACSLVGQDVFFKDESER